MNELLFFGHVALVIGGVILQERDELVMADVEVPA